MSSLFIIAGEVSGDGHAAGVMNELKALRPETQFTGLGGPKMREAGGQGIEDWLADAAVLGLWEVLKNYGYFKKKFSETLARVNDLKPDAVILVDYPGFNLRVAKALRGARYAGKIIYYISPQVWAWKKGRIKTMAKVLDLMICIFPFEKELYEASGLRTEFGGHPMVDRMSSLRKSWSRESKLVGWFPGSRHHEVRRIFPVMLQASRAILLAVPNARFAVSAANEALAAEMRDMMDEHGMPEAKRWIETGAAYDLMQRAEVAAVASGTATLEAACFGLPYVLVYRVNPLTYAVGKMVVKIKNLGIVNILAGREVVKERIQHELNPTTLAQDMVGLLQNDAQREALISDLGSVVSTLGDAGAYLRTARCIDSCLNS